MRNPQSIGRLLALVTTMTLASAAIAALFDGMTSVIDARLADPGLVPRKARSLRSAKSDLAGGGLLFDRARGAQKAVGHIESSFRRDVAFDVAEGTLVTELTAAIDADRDVLDARRGASGDPAFESNLTKRIALADRDLVRAAAAKGPVAALRHLVAAASDLRRAAPPEPNFRLPDVNPVTPTYGTDVSPRDFAETISAWYFGRAG
ncbi:MAG: hypothetical protein K8T90_07085 [Planctomycetes bacterium]|nr:hypothetical protein [Planctomycetota bacterium]